MPRYGGSGGHQQPPTAGEPHSHPESQAAISHLDTTASQGPHDPPDARTDHPQDLVRHQDAQPAQHEPPPSPAVPPPHDPPCPPTRPEVPSTDSPHGGTHQPQPPPPPVDAPVREPPLPRPPRETPSPEPAHRRGDPPPPPTPAPSPHAAPPAAAPAEPPATFVLHNAPAVLQRLRAVGGNQEALRVRTSGTTPPIRAATLVQAATLGQGVRDFLFDAFLHVARHERPRSPSPTANARPPRETASGCPPSIGGGTLSETPAGAGDLHGPHPLPRPRHGATPT